MWSERICGDRISPFGSKDLIEVKGLSSGWLLCFSDLHLEPQYLSLGFLLFMLQTHYVDTSGLINRKPCMGATLVQD